MGNGLRFKKKIKLHPNARPLYFFSLTSEESQYD